MSVPELHLCLPLHDRFWNLLAPYCTVHTGVKKIPFVTSTCRGYGKTARIDGEVIWVTFILFQFSFFYLISCLTILKTTRKLIHEFPLLSYMDLGFAFRPFPLYYRYHGNLLSLLSTRYHVLLQSSLGCTFPSMDKSQCPTVSAHIHQYVL